jgi:ubiquinone/menaquinone biosynthesis C-methylase UbiE
VLVLAEVQRVLKPGGIFIFIEHVQARTPVLRTLQNILTPLQTLLADGCHLNRKTADLLREYGGEFSEIEIEEFTVDLGFGSDLIATQICGYATKRTSRAGT